MHSFLFFGAYDLISSISLLGMILCSIGKLLLLKGNANVIEAGGVLRDLVLN